jgi:hypothetical protein
VLSRLAVRLCATVGRSWAGRAKPAGLDAKLTGAGALNLSMPLGGKVDGAVEG